MCGIRLQTRPDGSIDKKDHNCEQVLREDVQDLERLVINMRNESEIKISDLRKKKVALNETKEEAEAKQSLFNYVGVLPEQKSISLMEAWNDWFGESEHG